MDLEKAYDRVSIDAIAQVMLKKGISPQFTALIKHLGEIGQARVLVNGFLSRMFHVRSGVRQGDPLSPLLFNFAMELITRPFLADASYRGIDIFDRCRTIIALYADDTCLFGTGHRDFQRIQRQFGLFEKATCSRANINKSFFLAPYGCSFDHQPYPALPVAGDKYLGFTINQDGIVSSINQRIDGVISALKRWKSTNLSLFGRVSVVKAYAYSRLVYHLRFDWPTESRVKRLQQCVNWFLWHNSSHFDPTRKYSPRMTTERSLQRRECGGLNLLPVESLIQHYKAWFAWSIAIKQNSDWYKHVNAFLKKVGPANGQPPGIHPLRNLNVRYHFNGWQILKKSLDECRNLIKLHSLNIDDLLAAESPFKLLRQAGQSNEPALTKRMREVTTKRYNVRWKRCFKLVRTLPVRGQLKSFYFKMLTNSTTWFSSKNCGCGSEFDSFWHMFECAFFKKVRKHLKSVMEKHFDSILRYHRRVVYGVPVSIRNRTLIIVALWALWRTRNKYIYEDQEPSIPFIHNIFRSELDRALQLQFTRRGADKFHGIWMHQQINLANTICITNGRPKLFL
jgi:hypothetical protein